MLARSLTGPPRLTGLTLLLTGGTEPELERLIQRGICGGCEGFKGTSETGIARRRLSNVFQRLIDDDWLEGEREGRSVGSILLASSPESFSATN